MATRKLLKAKNPKKEELPRRLKLELLNLSEKATSVLWKVKDPWKLEDPLLLETESLALLERVTPNLLKMLLKRTAANLSVTELAAYRRLTTVALKKLTLTLGNCSTAELSKAITLMSGIDSTPLRLIVQTPWKL